MLRHLLTESYN